MKGEALEFIRSARIEELETAAQLGVLSRDVASILISGANPLTVAEAIPRWKEHMEYRRLSPRSIANAVIWVKAWSAWSHLEKKPLSDLKISDLDGWINGEACENKLGSRKVMLSALRSFCGFCQDSGWMTGNPANLIKVDLSLLLHAQKETLKRPCFTDEEVQILTEGTGPGGDCEHSFWHAAIIIGRYTGLRMGDIASLQWASLSLEGKGSLAVWTTKRDRRVELPLEPEILRSVFSSIPSEHPVYLFNHERVLNADVGARCSLSMQFSRIMRALQIPIGKTFHCLRATYISDCAANGIPIHHISQAVGHATPDTTHGYIRESGSTQSIDCSDNGAQPAV
jgi:integrase